MSTQNIQVGDTVPIELQITDGATDQYPRALVYNQASSLVDTIDLVHNNQGNYSGLPYTMPDTEFIKIIYIVYSDAGHLTVNTKYGRDLEIFYRTNWVNEALRIETVTEMPQGSPPADATMEQMMNYLYRKLINKTRSSLVLDRIISDDGVTELFKTTLGDAAGVFTKERYRSGV